MDPRCLNDYQPTNVNLTRLRSTHERDVFSKAQVVGRGRVLEGE